MVTSIPRDPNQKQVQRGNVNATPRTEQKGFLQKASDFLGFTPLANYTAGKLFNLTPEARQIEQSKQQATLVRDNLLQEITRRKRLGQDTSSLEKVLSMQDRNVSSVGGVQKSLKTGGGVTGRQALGSALNVVATAVPFGRFVGGAGKAVGQIGKQTTGQLLKQTAKLGAKEGFLGGTVSGIGYGLQDRNATVGSVLKSGVTGAVGGTVAGGILAPALVGVGALGNKAFNIARGKEKILDPNKIMTRFARLSKPKQEKFYQRFGKTVGQALNERGLNKGSPDEVLGNVFARFNTSYNEANKAFELLDNNPATFKLYKPQEFKNALDELVRHQKSVSAPNAPSRDLQRVLDLEKKFNTTGIDMRDSNEIKRLYERNVRTDYVKSFQTRPEKLTRATNIDSAMRKWQFKQAKLLGIKNIDEINKETSMMRFLSDEWERAMAGKEGNNALGLNDTILLSGGDPQAIGMLLTKKLISWPRLQAAIARKIAGRPSVMLPKAVLESPDFKALLEQSPKLLEAPQTGTPRSSIQSTQTITALPREGMEFTGQGLATPMSSKPTLLQSQQGLSESLPDTTPNVARKSTSPVEAFGKSKIGVLFPVAGATLAGAVVAGQMKKTKPVEGGTATSTTPIAIQNKDKKSITIKTSEVESELKPILFGEVSNRSTAKKELEMRVILSTAINRMKEYAQKGKPKTLSEILSMPNQYQAYKGEQYNKYKTNKLDTLGVAKKSEVDSITEKLLQEVKDGTFKDVTNGAFYYIHNKDGSITYDDIKPLFKK